MKNARKKNYRQQGIALVLTLGILSMLLILAMSYAFNARSELRSATIHADMVQGRLMNDSQIGSIATYIQSQFASNIYPGKDSFYLSDRSDSDGYNLPASSAPYWSDDWEGRHYIVKAVADATPAQDTPYARDSYGINKALHVAFNDIDFTPENFGSETSLQAVAGWEYLWITHPAEDGNPGSSKLRGRRTYIMIDESGKIDPNAAIKSGIDESSVSASTSTNRRIGNSPHEINLSKAFGSVAVSDAALNGLATDADPTKRWLSWRQLLESGNAIFTNDDSRQDAYTSMFPLSYDIEAYNHGAGDKQRFDLNKTAAEWDAYTYTDMLTAPGDFWTSATDTRVAAESGGIGYLTGTADATMAKQIAANIKDYCDSDSIATVDYVGGSADQATCSFTGLEEVPYINAVSINVSNISGDNLIELELELANIYSEAIPVDAYVYIDWAITTGPPAQQMNGTMTFAFNSANSRSFPGLANRYEVQKYQQDTGYDGSNKLAIDAIRAFVVPVGSGVSATTVQDFAHVLSTRENGSGLADGDEENLFFEIADPRQNVSTSDWGPPLTGGFTTLSTGTSTLRNSTKIDASITAAGANKDVECGAAFDPVHATNGFSTAFIRNGPMESLWELGFLHRGAAWQTINLKAHSATKTDWFMHTNYATGDGPLLDYVHVSDERISNNKGTVNANSRNILTWTAMLSNIYYGASRSVDNDGISFPNGTQLESTFTLSDLAKAIVDTSKTGTWESRGQICSVTALSTTGTAAAQLTTDAMQEEIIGKLAGLLNVRSTYYTVITTSQAVKDLGELPNGAVDQFKTIYDYPEEFFPYTNTGDSASDTRYAIRLAEERAMTVIYRDALNDSVRVERTEAIFE